MTASLLFHRFPSSTTTLPLCPLSRPAEQLPRRSSSVATYVLVLIKRIAAALLHSTNQNTACHKSLSQCRQVSMLSPKLAQNAQNIPRYACMSKIGYSPPSILHNNCCSLKDFAAKISRRSQAPADIPDRRFCKRFRMRFHTRFDKRFLRGFDPRFRDVLQAAFPNACPLRYLQSCRRMFLLSPQHSPPPLPSRVYIFLQ